jgi:hypothetical protein
MTSVGTVVVVDTRSLWSAVNERLFRTGKDAKVIAGMLGFSPQIFSDLKAAATGVGGRDGIRQWQPSSPIFMSICFWLRADPRDFQRVTRPIRSPEPARPEQERGGAT